MALRGIPPRTQSERRWDVLRVSNGEEPSSPVDPGSGWLQWIDRGRVYYRWKAAVSLHNVYHESGSLLGRVDR
ncbi:hypothetical protein BRC77_00790 [Halobacteriales archaeon QH_8_64_26]|nr:MAG: hypothetical protein BRC77_00790 [Halobacteriales archaeon QH_8_64_26]